MKIIPLAKPIINFSSKNENRKWINCSDCIYSKTINHHKTVCKLFKYSYLTYFEENSNIDIIYCRSDFNLCGPYADFFKPKKDN